MERGVVVGGLMVCGSFLLAALLNRSAMEEPAAPATHVTVVPPVVAPASQVEIEPSVPDCAKADAREDIQPAATETEQPAPDCSDAD